MKNHVYFVKDCQNAAIEDFKARVPIYEETAYDLMALAGEGIGDSELEAKERAKSIAEQSLVTARALVRLDRVNSLIGQAGAEMQELLNRSAANWSRDLSKAFPEETPEELRDSQVSYWRGNANELLSKAAAIRDMLVKLEAERDMLVGILPKE